MKHIIINSSQRNSSSTSSANYYVDLENIAIDKKRKLKLIYWTLPNVIYNISSANNKIDFNENSTDKVATVTNGNYTFTELETEIKSALDTASSGYNTFTVDLSSITYKTTISAGNNFSLLFSSGANADNSPWKLLGFTLDGLSGVDTTAGTSTTSSSYINLSRRYGYYVDMEINGIGMKSHMCVAGSNRQFSFFIPNSSQDGEFNTPIDSRFLEQVLDIPEHILKINRISIKIYDDDHSIVDLGNVDNQFVFRLEE